MQFTITLLTTVFLDNTQPILTFEPSAAYASLTSMPQLKTNSNLNPLGVCSSATHPSIRAIGALIFFLDV
jgi:hypothetical protein